MKLKKCLIKTAKIEEKILILMNWPNKWLEIGSMIRSLLVCWKVLEEKLDLFLKIEIYINSF